MFKNFKFIPSRTEDYDMLKRLLESGKRMILTDDITYFVKGIPPTYKNRRSLKKKLPMPFLLNKHEYDSIDKERHESGFNCTVDKDGYTQETRFEYKSIVKAEKYIGKLHSNFLDRVHELYPKCKLVNQNNGFYIPSKIFLALVHPRNSKSFIIRVLNENMMVVQNWLFGLVNFTARESNFFFPSLTYQTLHNGEIDDSLCFSI
eukprot:Pgem_evm1s16268